MENTVTKNQEAARNDTRTNEQNNNVIRFRNDGPIQQTRKEEETIDLKMLFGEIFSRWWLLVIAFIVGAVIVGGYTYMFVTPQYQSQSKIYIYSKTTSITSLADLQIGSQLTSDFQIIAKTREVIDDVIEKLELDMTYEQLVSEISITNPDESRILGIVVTDPDPERAKDIANTMANVLRNRIGEVTNTDKPSVVEKAVASYTRVSPSYTKNAALGGIILLVIVGIILAIVYLSDDTIKNEDDVKKYLGLNVLAMMPVNRNEKPEVRSNSHKNKKK